MAKRGDQMQPEDLPRRSGEDAAGERRPEPGGVLDSRPKPRGLNRLIRTGRRRAARAEAPAARTPAQRSMVPAGRLTIDLVPKTSRHGSVRALMDDVTWDRVCSEVYRQAGYRCEVCGGRGAEHPVECHELWRYDDRTRVQTLVRMIALCPDCHQVKHLGHADVQATGAHTRAHLARVNGWLRVQTDAYISEAFREWAQRNQGPWTVDLDGLRPYVAREEYLSIVRVAAARTERPATSS
ncbi:MAG TPA: hypothetical protein VFA45_17140 [Actinomycetes bacterium]|jgi:hypothetical protein|nr:hypothetical protein [Actinomycetes bacterium]